MVPIPILYIVTSADVLRGSAALYRKLALAKGFQCQGYDVQLLCYRMYGRSAMAHRKGRIFNVPYRILSPRIAGTSYFMKTASYFYGSIIVLLSIENRPAPKLNLVWSNETNLLFHFPLFILTRLRGMGYFIEYNENPFIWSCKYNKAL